MRDEVFWAVFRAQADGVLPLRQRVRLREEVAHQLVVVGHQLTLCAGIAEGRSAGRLIEDDGERLKMIAAMKRITGLVK